MKRRLQSITRIVMSRTRARRSSLADRPCLRVLVLRAAVVRLFARFCLGPSFAPATPHRLQRERRMIGLRSRPRVDDRAPRPSLRSPERSVIDASNSSDCSMPRTFRCGRTLPLAESFRTFGPRPKCARPPSSTSYRRPRSPPARRWSAATANCAAAPGPPAHILLPCSASSVWSTARVGLE